MCGIFCNILYNDVAYLKKQSQYQEVPNYNLNSRGPDAQDSFICHFPGENGFKIEMIGTTLWTQGDKPLKQPLQSKNGVILFNGDIFDDSRNKHLCDTEELLLKLSRQIHTTDAFIATLRSIIGPFGLIFWDCENKKLYFCRDKYGRKSLLLYVHNNGFILSSVLERQYKGSIELSSACIYCIDVEKKIVNEFPWNENSLEKQCLPLENWMSSLVEIVNDSYTSSSVLNDEESNLMERIEKISEMYPCGLTFLKNLLNIEEISIMVNNLIELLSKSVRMRVTTQPGRCKKCVNSNLKCDSHCTTGILFSGGLDCTILAALAHKYLPLCDSIDLLNVAFENKNCTGFDVPDRLTSLKSLGELKRIYPERKWNLLEINVKMQELRDKQIEIISDLVFPLQTILDESLGSALWFAARGETSSYKSSCRIILMGMGADELFGGYMRHRNAFKRSGWKGLEKELHMDWRRLPHRNLARDDRVVSHHGCQPRMPYLDEHFLNYVLKLKPWEKCFMGNVCQSGIGDKMILRLVAIKLGLECTSLFPKRALQFGSKIANKNENACDISPRLFDVTKMYIE